jgi:thioredoxin 1
LFIITTKLDFIKNNTIEKRSIIMSVITITKENFETEVMNSNKPVLLDFWASWCGPCRMLSPIVEEIAEEMTDAKIGKINVDEQPELASKYNIMSIPTLLVFKNGEVANSAIGVQSKSAILSLLK